MRRYALYRVPVLVLYGEAEREICPLERAHSCLRNCCVNPEQTRRGSDEQTEVTCVREGSECQRSPPVVPPRCHTWRLVAWRRWPVFSDVCVYIADVRWEGGARRGVPTGVHCLASERLCYDGEHRGPLWMRRQEVCKAFMTDADLSRWPRCVPRSFTHTHTYSHTTLHWPFKPCSKSANRFNFIQDTFLVVLRRSSRRLPANGGNGADDGNFILTSQIVCC